MVWRINEVATVIWNLGTSGYSDVKCQIYDETHAAFGSPVNMTEIGVTGIYFYDFTPDNDGVWLAHVYKGSDEDTFLYVVGWGVEGRAGGILKGICDSGMSGSTTVIVCADLKGFKDDFFNTNYSLYVVYNDGTPGSAPEGEMQDITNYVTATGTFTTAAFTGNVEANDVILIVHSAVVGDLQTILENNDLDHLLKIAHPSGDPVADSIMDLVMNKDGGQTFARATDSLEALRELCDLLATTAALVIVDEFHDVPAVDAILNAQINEVLGNKADTAAVSILNTNSLMRYMKGALGATWTSESLKAIYDLLDAILDLTETGNTFLADGLEQDLYINNAPSGVFEPRVVFVDLTNMAGTDSVTIREKYRIKSGGSLVVLDEKVYTGPQTARPLIKITLEPNRYGIETTLEQTAGTYRNFDWEAFYAG